MPGDNYRDPQDALSGYGEDEGVPHYLAVWAEHARNVPIEEVADLDAIADALGVPPLRAEDIPGVRERKHGYEVWHGKNEKGQRRYIGTFPTVAEAARAKEIAAGVALDATILGDKGAKDSQE